MRFVGRIILLLLSSCLTSSTLGWLITVPPPPVWCGIAPIAAAAFWMGGTDLLPQTTSSSSTNTAIGSIPPLVVVEVVASSSSSSTHMIASQQQPPRPPSLQEQIERSLTPASEERPQIQLPASDVSMMQNDEKAPIVEALLYLPNAAATNRPGPLDTIVVTVSDLRRPDVVLAGAKIPRARRFPIQIRLFRQNILKDHSWNEIQAADALLVKAAVCPEGSAIPCPPEEVTFKAQGVAKMVENLPGLPEGVRVRAGAALPLQ